MGHFQGHTVNLPDGISIVDYVDDQYTIHCSKVDYLYNY